MTSSNMKTFSISPQNKKAIEIWDKWLKQGVVVADKLAKLMIKVDEEEERAKLSAQNGGLSSNEAFVADFSEGNDGHRVDKNQSPFPVDLPSIWDIDAWANNDTLKKITSLPSRELGRLNKNTFIIKDIVTRYVDRAQEIAKEAEMLRRREMRARGGLVEEEQKISEETKIMRERERQQLALEAEAEKTI